MCDIYEDTETIFAKTLYGEARGEGLSGIEAVASVILNRVQIAKDRGGFWWGNSIREVCLKPFQFSCWNGDDPNFDALQEVDERNSVYALCLRIVHRAMVGYLKDMTGGATHYHTLDVSPAWARKWIPCAQIGRHLFYRELS